LLIFFMVTSTFAEEQAIRIEPPAPADGPSEGEAMLIHVDQDSVVRVNGRLTDIGSVRAAIERLRAETPEIRIALQAHPQAKTGVLALIRDAAYDAGYTEGVSLALDRT
ncbi:MAG: biopolymer transporter ExbD, partial [Hyphomonas sp.]|nr:biopolymer transporter ExbD [Hyphomonas sp.]